MLNFASLPSSLSCIYYSMTCLYVGSTRSLYFYNVKKEGDAISNTENSLISLKTAISIPVIATVSLLVAYLMVVNELDFVSMLLSIYFSYVAVLVLKRFLYEYSRTNSALVNID
jgi:type IV secretory pathway VirB3-like protein